MQRRDLWVETAGSKSCVTNMILTMRVRKVTTGLGVFREKKVAVGKMRIDELMYKEEMRIPCGNKHNI